MARKLTFTHPRTGEVFTRTTDADYTHVSVKNGEAKWHLDAGAARRRGGEVYPLSGPASGSDPARVFNDRRKPQPQSFKTMWDHIYDDHGGRMPAAMSGDDAAKLAKLRQIHDDEHSGGYSQLKHKHP